MIIFGMFHYDLIWYRIIPFKGDLNEDFLEMRFEIMNSYFCTFDGTHYTLILQIHFFLLE